MAHKGRLAQATPLVICNGPRPETTTSRQLQRRRHSRPALSSGSDSGRLGRPSVRLGSAGALLGAGLENQGGCWMGGLAERLLARL
eukprot:1800431-Pleurochrysis_carterae.AAC.8